MPRYSVFGRILESPIDFPELREATGTPAWELTRESGSPSSVGTHVVGSDELIQGIHARLLRTPDGLRLEFDDTGIFDVTHGGRRVGWYPPEKFDEELARVDFLGRVLAVCEHIDDVLCLHASAVVIDGNAIGFMAPKGFGKSTLAMTLVSRGARLLTDDTLPVEADTGIARPGVHSVRLRDDSVRRFQTLGDGRLGLSNKTTFDALPVEWITTTSAPLAGLYALLPVAPDHHAHSVTSRELRSPPSATHALMQFCKLGSLLGSSEAATVLDRAIRIATRIPIYGLHIPRNLEQIDRVADSVMEWHHA